MHVSRCPAGAAHLRTSGYANKSFLSLDSLTAQAVYHPRDSESADDAYPEQRSRESDSGEHPDHEVALSARRHTYSEMLS